MLVKDHEPWEPFGRCRGDHSLSIRRSRAERKNVWRQMVKLCCHCFCFLIQGQEFETVLGPSQFFYKLGVFRSLIRVRIALKKIYSF